jgi:hypothetical protein
MIADFRLGNVSVAGDIGCHLTYADYDTILEAALFGAFDTPSTQTASTISASSTDNSLNDSGNGFVTAGFKVGDWITIAGFTTPATANNGVGKITSITAAKIVIASGLTLVTKAAGDSITLTSLARLDAGVTVKSLSIERGFLAITTPIYDVFTGCMVNGFALDIKPNAIVNGTFSLIGMGASTSGSSLGTPAAASTNSPFDSFKGTLMEGGTAIARVTGLQLKLDNGSQAIQVVGNANSADVVEGRSNLTGSLSAYFQDNTLRAKFLNETESALGILLEDLATGTHGNRYYIDIPRLKYNGGDRPVSNEQAIVMTMPFQALVDSVTGTNMIIQKLAAA